MATVRYIVDDVETAIAFYTGLLGFELKQHFGSAIGILEKDDLELWSPARRRRHSGRCRTAVNPRPAGGTDSSSGLRTSRRPSPL